LPDEKAELKQSYNTIKKYWGVNGAQSKSLVNKREGLQVRILLLKRRPSNLLVLGERMVSSKFIHYLN
jgi:hypothetical protein